MSSGMAVPISSMPRKCKQPAVAYSRSLKVGEGEAGQIQLKSQKGDLVFCGYLCNMVYFPSCR